MSLRRRYLSREAIKHVLPRAVLPLHVAAGELARWRSLLALVLRLLSPCPPRSPLEPCCHALFSCDRSRKKEKVQGTRKGYLVATKDLQLYMGSVVDLSLRRWSWEVKHDD
jgi:hypothetical protein